MKSSLDVPKVVNTNLDYQPNRDQFRKTFRPAQTFIVSRIRERFSAMKASKARGDCERDQRVRWGRDE